MIGTSSRQADANAMPGKGLRIAVAGASHWHLPRYVTLLREAGGEFSGVSDPEPQVAQRWAAELGCAAVPDPRAFVSGRRPDLVLALGRVSDQAAQAIGLLEEGLPLLAEKPLGSSAAQVARVDEVARRRGSWISVALAQRYDPFLAVIGELRQNGRLGRLTHGHVHIVNGPPRRYAAWGCEWMLHPETAGGGALLNLGIHGMDFLAHLTDEPLVVAGAALSSIAHGEEIEDYGAATLRSEGGFVGVVEAGYTYPDASAGMTRSGDTELRVGGSGAYLIGQGSDLFQVLPGEPELTRRGARGGDRYHDWIFDSLSRFRRGEPPLAGTADCLRAVRLVEAAYAAAGKPPADATTH